MKIYNEQQILDEKFRAMVIEEIVANENIERKKEALKRYDIFKDNTKKWVIDKLTKEGLGSDTIALMSNRSSNISICKKIINKISRAYSGGVIRETLSAGAKLQIEVFEKKLSWNTKMRKTDKYLNLFKNTLVGIVPVISKIEDEKKYYELAMKVLAPWQYDALELASNREKAECIIISDYLERSQIIGATGDGVDQTIADSPDDQNRDAHVREFIWWSNSYHFTTDEHGRILAIKSPQDLKNPIMKNPWQTVSEDQDGSFWAQGGEDLTEGSILVNTLITDMFSIAYMQGWGQTVITGGEQIPNKFAIGPHRALIIKYDKDNDPKPEVNIQSANPPLDAWMRAIEQYVALLLSTNNLAPSNISMKLDANTFPSGIAMMIEQSEHTDNIVEKQEIFKNVERELWKTVFLWQQLFLSANALTDDFAEIGKVIAPIDVSIKFNAVVPPVSEKEKLEIIKMRQELGINTMIELLKKDNPDLSDEEVEKKLLLIMKEKLEKMRASMPVINEPSQEEEDDELDNGQDSVQIQS
jgi:hypothetical protein